MYRDAIRNEIQSLKKQYQTNKQKREMALAKESSDKTKSNKLTMDKDTDNEYIKDFLDDRTKYQNLKSQIPLKGNSR